jgi:hypothetical protein
MQEQGGLKQTTLSSVQVTAEHSYFNSRALVLHEYTQQQHNFLKVLTLDRRTKKI